MRNKTTSYKNQVQNQADPRKHWVHESLRVYVPAVLGTKIFCRFASTHKLDRSGVSCFFLMWMFQRIDRHGNRLDLTSCRWDGNETLADIFGVTEEAFCSYLKKLYKLKILSNRKWGRTQRCYALSRESMDWIVRQICHHRLREILSNQNLAISTLPNEFQSKPWRHHATSFRLCPGQKTKADISESSSSDTNHEPEAPPINPKERSMIGASRSSLDEKSESEIGSSSTTLDSESGASRPNHDDEIRSSRSTLDSRLGRDDPRDWVVTTPQSYKENLKKEIKEEEEESQENSSSSSSDSLSGYFVSDQKSGDGKVICITKNARHLKRSSFWATLKENAVERRLQSRMDGQGVIVEDRPQEKRIERKIEITFDPEIELNLSDFAQDERKRYFGIIALLITENQRNALYGTLKEDVYQAALKLVRCGHYDSAMEEIRNHLANDGCDNIHQALVQYAKAELDGNVSQAWKGFLKTLDQKFIKKK